MRFLILILTAMNVLISPTLVQEQNLAPYTLQWSPDGQWLARGYTDGIVAITSLSDRYETIELKHNGNISSIAWSPDSSRVAVGLYANEIISIWDIHSRSLLTTLKGDIVYEGGGMYLAWNPREEILASLAYDWGGHPIQFWETETYSQIGVAEDLQISDASPSIKWSPNGTQLAVTTLSQGLRLYDLFRGDSIASKHRFEGFPLPGGISYTDWSPDGTQLAVMKYETQFIFDEEQHITLSEHDSFLVSLDIKTLEEGAQITQPVHNAMAPFSWSPDGGRIAILHPNQIEIIDAQTGVLLEQFPTDHVNADWSPFGGRLAISGSSDQTSPIDDIQIVVPAPSLDLLNTIAATCAPNLAPKDDLSAYIDAVNTDPSIAPACAADLIAVAEALQAEQPSSP